MRTRSRWFLLLAILAVAVAGPGRSDAATIEGFVTRSGTDLVLGDEPWRFVGYNDFRLTSTPSSPAACGARLSDQEVRSELARLRQLSGASVVRTWFFQSLGGPGNWTGFDRVIRLATEQGIRVVPVLVNGEGDCEPTVAGRLHQKDPAWFTSGYKTTGDGYKLSFREFTSKVVDRYRRDPGIAFWQIGNELRADYKNNLCDPAVANPALRRFADDIASVIRSTDRNHLISLGTMGSGQCGANGSPTAYRDLHSGGIDLCEYHDYGDPLQAMPGDAWNGLARRLQDCASIDRPLVVGELGIQRGIHADGGVGIVTASTLARRSALVDAKLTEQFSSGVAGVLAWAQGSTDGFQLDVGDQVEAVLARHADSL